MRQGSTLSAAAKEIGVDPRTVTRHLGNTLGKRSGKYLAKSSDRISRGLKIYSDGKQLVITIKDSKAASTIGQYFNAVRKFLGAGDSSGLKYYTNLAVVDSNGIKYRLETNAKKILAIEERKEDPEGFELYDKV